MLAGSTKMGLGYACDFITCCWARDYNSESLVLTFSWRWDPNWALLLSLSLRLSLGLWASSVPAHVYDTFSLLHFVALAHVYQTCIPIFTIS